MRLKYAQNAGVVTFALGEKWNWDGIQEHNPDPQSYQVTFAREFRYDGARARYLNRKVTMSPTYTQGEAMWTDYDGDERYEDFDLDTSRATPYFGEWWPGRKSGLLW